MFSLYVIIVTSLYVVFAIPRLRTNGVNTHGAAAKVTNFGRSGKKVRPGTFGKIEAA